MGILDLFFPVYCLECKKEGKYLCSDCANKVLDGNFDSKNFAVFKYKGVVRKAITSIKYRYAYDIVDSLVEATVSRLKISKIHNVTLVPIPMYSKSENIRGFNQSILIGEKIAKSLDWNFLPDLLIKTKNTKHQVGLKGEQRKTNLENAFIVNPKYKENIEIRSNKILLFDDVYTTGTTIKQARKVLENSGFKNVYSLTIAR